MRLRLAILAGVLVLVLGAGAVAVAQPVWRVPARAVSNKRAARRDVRTLLGKLVLPAGAVAVAQDPGQGRALANVAGYPATPALIDLHRFWRVPESAGAVISWLQSHPPAGSSQEETYGPGCCTPALEATTLGFEFSPVAGAIGSRELLVGVAVAPGGDAAVRADAQDVYWVPRPKWERVPAGAHMIDVTVERLNPSSTSSATVTEAATIRRIVSLVNALPPGQPGVESCPADDGPDVSLRFLASDGKTDPLAKIVADGSGCGGVSAVVSNRRAPALAGGRTFVPKLEHLLGIGK